jgi:hypothetical protein
MEPILHWRKSKADVWVKRLPLLGARIFDLAYQVEHHKVFCFSPHSLHLYGTRTSPGSAETRFDAPHFPHLASIRVRHCLTVTVLRSKASFTRRSVSSRITCFDMPRFLCISFPRSRLHLLPYHNVEGKPGLASLRVRFMSALHLCGDQAMISSVRQPRRGDVEVVEK